MRASAHPPSPRYRPPPWLRGGHAQTIYPYWLRGREVAFRRERVLTADGDFWDFDWLDAGAPPDAPLIVLFHGLEGSSRSHYARALMRLAVHHGWRGVIPHFRGCSGELNLVPRAYHSGDFEEVGGMLAAIARRNQPAAPVYAVGVSLGGSALLNWLGREGAGAGRTLKAAAAVSTPLDLAACGTAISKGFNKVYTYHFLQTLKPKSLQLAARFPDRLSADAIRRVRSMWDFDEAVTAPLHGFAGADDYWHRASSKPWLKAIRVPTLVLNACNDPFVPAASLPVAAEASKDVLLEQPADGGHCGFASGRFPGKVQWLPERLLHFFVCGH